MADLMRSHCDRCNQEVECSGSWCTLYAYGLGCVGRQMDRVVIARGREAMSRDNHEWSHLTDGDEVRCRMCGTTLRVADG